MNIASALETTLRWVIRTALGDPVDPDVNCSSATSSSSVSTGSIGRPSSSCSTVSTRIPSWDSSGAAAMNGSEITTALASIMLMTAVVSSAQRCRSVRGVGWCSMVRLAPRIQMPCAVGAISAGAPASTATASPRPTPAAARPPAIRRARSCTSTPGMPDGAFGSPVTMPFELHWALPYIVSVNLLKTIPPAPAPLRATGLRPRVGTLNGGRAYTSAVNASVFSREACSEIAGAPRLLVLAAARAPPARNEADDDCGSRACPFHAHPGWSLTPIEAKCRGRRTQ